MQNRTTFTRTVLFAAALLVVSGWLVAQNNNGNVGGPRLPAPQVDMTTPLVGSNQCNNAQFCVFLFDPTPFDPEKAIVDVTFRHGDDATRQTKLCSDGMSPEVQIRDEGDPQTTSHLVSIRCDSGLPGNAIRLRIWSHW